MPDDLVFTSGARLYDKVSQGMDRLVSANHTPYGLVISTAMWEADRMGPEVVLNRKQVVQLSNWLAACVERWEVAFAQSGQAEKIFPDLELPSMWGDD